MEERCFAAEDGEFLLDPAQWEDRLPQPFRAVNDFIDQVLEETWCAILAREREQQRESLEVPELSQSRLLAAGDDVCAGEGDTVFVWGGGSVRVLEVGRDEVLVQSEGVEVKEGSVGWCETGQKTMHVLAALTQEGEEVVIFAFMRATSQLLLLTRVPAQEGGKVVQVKVAHCCSYLALTCQGQDGVSLEIYGLPVAAWLGEIGTGLEEEERVEGSYSKPSLCLTLSHPEPAQSVFSGDPVSALQRVRECCATAQFHLLTEQYFEARRKVFLSQQAGSTSEPSAALDDLAPTYHFLLQTSQQDQFAVWWAGSTELLFYSLTDNSLKGRERTPLHTLSQATTITATSVSVERRLMAVGLSSGTVGVWGIDTKQVVSILAVAGAPDAISALSFLPGAGEVYSLAVGTAQGGVMMTMEEEALLRLELRSPHQCSRAVTRLAVCSSLPGVMMSVHGSGDVFMWSLKQCQLLCRVSVPSSWDMIHDATYSSSGQYIVLTGEASGRSEVFCVNLHGSSCLQTEWGRPLVPPYKEHVKCAMEKFAEACMAKHTQYQHAGASSAEEIDSQILM